MTQAEQLSFEKVRVPTQDQIDWLTQWNGVPAIALAKDPGEWGFVIGFADVVFGDGFFNFADEGDGVGAYIFLARDEFGEPIDLVAWCPDGERLAPCFGRVGLLGEQNLWPRFESRVRVHPSPIDWLRSGREGVVVVDHRFAAGLLRDAGELSVSSIGDGQRLREIIAERPSIFVEAA